MDKLYRQFYFNTVAAVILIIGINISVSAQETLQGIVRLKVSESLAATLERQSLARTSTGEVLTGVQSLDRLNRQFHVRKFSRVFPHAGKHEARHRKHGLHLWYEATLDQNIPVATVLKSYQSEAQIMRIEPVYKKALIGSGSPVFEPPVISGNTLDDPMTSGVANDPMLSSQWHYNNTGQSGGTPGADIDLFNAWKIETGRKNVIIAVTDGGVDINHPDLAPNLWVNDGEIPGNNRDDDNNGYVDDVHGFSFVHGKSKILADNHGTHVAGTVAAVTNNNQGVAGVAGGSGVGDGVRIMSCAVFHADTLAAGFAEAYVYSADNGAVISQNSWGYTLPGVFEQVVLDAIDYFVEQAGNDFLGKQTGPIDGGLVIFSSGNYNDQAEYYPASYESVVAVASTTHKDTRSRYSNYGSWIDIVAPGGETYEHQAEGVISTLPNGNYGWYMGTSMACPHVSGVAGLIVSKFGRPGLSADAVRRRLLGSVDNIDLLNPGFEGKLGAGRVNALVALDASDQSSPPAITDLKVLDKDVGEITMGWTSPGEGPHAVSAYDLRYSTTPITHANFNGATKATHLPAPGAPGSPETFTVKDLPGGVLHYFAIRSQTFAGNFSAISNVVSATAAETPVIDVSPAALLVNLKTAEQSSRELIIRNNGKGPLRFMAIMEAAPDPFASTATVEDVVLPGASKAIRVTFNAAGLAAGTYNQMLNIESNDPLNKSVTIALTLQVSDNGAPIAVLDRQIIDFKSVQIGESPRRKVRVSNEGSEPLTISKATSSHPAFSCPLKTTITIPSFQHADLDVVFEPSRVGIFSAEVSFKVNDPARPTLKLTVQGEALQEAPVIASPSEFNETLEQGTAVTRTMVLRNNGSQDRQYRIEVADNRLITEAGSSNARKMRANSGAGHDSAVAQYNRRREDIKVELSRRSQHELALVRSIGNKPLGQTSSNTRERKRSAQGEETRRYVTGFEEFATGPLNEQQGWFTSQGWNIDTANPAAGEKHFRGASQSSGTGEKFALSPYLFEADEYLYPRYTSASMRINVDAARGASWEIVPQDPWSYIATRIRFNPDRSMEALVIDNNYEFHWKKVPVQTPSGYFDLAIEYNNWGSDTSGFPTYLLFINNQHVFSGTGLGSGIGQIAFVSPMETTGPLFDIDEFNLSGAEFVPQFVKPAAAHGTIPANGSVNVSLAFDATTMKYGTYTSDIFVHVDDTDTLVIPATLAVTGEPSLTWDLWGIHMQIEDGQGDWQQMTLMNTGGRDIAFNFETDLTGLTVSPQEGTLKVRENEVINITFADKPGFYIDSLLLHNDAGEDGILPVNITVYELEGKFVAPDPLTIDIRSGEMTTQSIMLKNEGKNPVDFYAGVWPEAYEFVSIEPARGTIKDSLELILTIDARELSTGTMSWPLEFVTTDVNASVVYTDMMVNVLPRAPLTVALTSPVHGETFDANTTIRLSASVSPENSDVAKVEFFHGTIKIGEAATPPYTFDWTLVPPGEYSLTALVSAPDGTTATSSPVGINVEAICTASGIITREYWNKVKGNSLSRIPVHTAPDRVDELPIFEAAIAGNAHYGERVRGYICPPASGEYVFWVASSGKSELWISTDEDAANKKRIAMVRPGTNTRSWDQSSYQRSKPVVLEKGQTYYIEALHLHKKGDGHLAVGWQLPNGTLERPIAGSWLSPFIEPTAPPQDRKSTEDDLKIADNTASDPQIEMQVYPNPVEGQTLNIAIESQSLPQQAVREVVIRQLTGLTVYTERQHCAETCDAQVDVRSHLSPGVYILQVSIGGKVFTEKLLVR